MAAKTTVASVIIMSVALNSLLTLASAKSRLVLPFWYRLTQVVLDKGPLNVCVCVFSVTTQARKVKPI